METTSLRYLQWQDLFLTEKPYQVMIDLPEQSENQRSSNLTFRDGHQQQIQNARASQEHFELDIHGFSFVQHASQLQGDDFKDKAIIQNTYLPECAELIRSNMDGADRIHFYNWLVRDSDSTPHDGKAIDLSDPIAQLGPSRIVHIDQTPESTVERVLHELPSEAVKLLQGRVRLVNVWRPTDGTVQSWPLALCDGRTVSPSYLVSSDRVRRNYTGGTTYVLEEPNRKWYYLKQQRVDEVTLFKNFDSKSGVTKHAPHTSLNPTVDSNAHRRQSIEVRAIVFTYPDYPNQLIK